jgi:hypothetical protein
MPAQGVHQLDWGGRTWHAFSGTGALGQLWSPDQVQVGPKGTLLQAVANGVAGGISDPTPHLYGEWNVRFRMSAGAGAKYAILLIDHPHGSEIDFAEGKKGGDDERKIMTTSVHYADGSITHNQIDGDFTKYHTAGVIWKAGVVQFTLDGKVWATVANAKVPSVPMHFAIQTRSYAPGPPCVLEVASITPYP